MKLDISPAAHGPDELLDDDGVAKLAEQVGREILESRLEPGAWARALYQANGKHHEALGLYTRIRVNELSLASKEHQAKAYSFESRRVNMCMGNWKERQKFICDYKNFTHSAEIRPVLAKEKKSPSHALLTPRSGPQLNFVKASMPTIWLWILFFGTASSLALLCRLAAPGFTGVLAHLLTALAMLAAAVTVWAALGVRQILPRQWIVMGWKPLLVVSCNVVCISSMFLSAKVIRKSVTEDQVFIDSVESLQRPAYELAPPPVAEKNTELVTRSSREFREEY